MARPGEMTRFTLPAAIALAVTLHLAGCDKAPTQKRPEAIPTATTIPLPVPSISFSSTHAVPPAKTAAQLPVPPDRDPTHALAYWRAAMEGRDWVAARSVFGDFGAQSGMSEPAFAAAWGKHRIVNVTVGTGEQDGAAGSSYYEVPVTITGLSTGNKPYHLAGRLTLRRVNDVDGATPEQLRWHIEHSTLQP
jgi:hypothetical protein